MAEPLHPGDPRQLGAYYLDARLGAGGQGVVYEGYGPDGGRVAIKALHSVGDGFRDLLRKEVMAWRKVAPFCTTKVLHADLDGPTPYVVSEHVAGPDLAQAVARGGPYAAEELRRLAIGVATALVAVHRAKIVHRDLKPANILLGADGPRVIDFGIARIEELSTTTGTVKGTLRYMPPERYRGRNGDAKVDVWCWGAVVLFAATGRHAFDAGTVPALAHQVATHDPDTSMLDATLRPLVTAALSKDPAGRPSADELLLALVGGTDLAEAADEAVFSPPRGAGRPSRAEAAEAVYDALGPGAQEAVPRVLLRLVAPGERAEDTLRSARADEFTDDRDRAATIDQVLRAFTDAGVLVWEDGSVTLAGAALIRAWPRLREWVDTERAGLGVHRSLAGAARLWNEHGRKNSDLYQGTALATAQSWAAAGRRHLTLNLVEHAFLDAAAALTRRRGRLRTLLSAVLAVLLVLAIGAAGVAIDQRRTVVSQRDRAASAQIAGLSDTLRRTWPDTARRLAVAAWSIAETPEAWSALAAVRHQIEKDARLIPDFDVTVTDLDGTGRTLVAASGTRVGLWDVDTGRRLGTYTAAAGVSQLEFSHDGGTVAVATNDDRITVLDAPALRPRNGHRYRAALESANPDRMVLSRKGTYLVAGGTAGDGRGFTVWDTRTGRPTVERTEKPFPNPSFSPRENMLSVTIGSEVTWIDPRTGDDMAAPDFEIGDHAFPGPVAFGADGRAAISSAKGAGVLLPGSARPFELEGEVDHLGAELHFSPDGRWIASRFTLWEVTSGFRDAFVMRHPVASDECRNGTFRFSADGTELRCVSSEGVLHSLDISRYTRPPEFLVAGIGGFESATASRDGSTLALAMEGEAVEIWSTAPLRRRFTLRPDDLAHSPALRLSDDGRLLALRSGSDELEIWSMEERALIGVLPAFPGEVDGFDMDRMAFSPDGKTLARTQGGGNSASIEFWDLTTMKVIRSLPTPGSASRVEFRPDGDAVLTARGLIAFPSGKVIKKAPAGMHASRFSADGRTLYEGPASYMSALQFFDARTLERAGNELRTGELAQHGSIDPPFAFSPGDDRLLATAHRGARGAEIKVWDLRTRTQLGVTLTGHRDDYVIGMTFTPDGSSLISMDGRGTFFTHTIAPRRLAAELCEMSGGLSEQEWERHIPDVPYRETC
ncbi:WD40 repeat domain-containing serine/threonine-protein kinase [Actinomadura algeriensis]|uniref:WD40 repeat protein n=1 Tax=Actinomadura algeriensis TaxID=1679523 RepID=A0ABR9K193_9ACTN|nr:WD40 repeat domain-containing serine/threonine-protein kinase [Actinomadura algeriensis]MBE1536606.1 WD40 repeat protein [Actinomadura algeriensis]